MKKQNTSMKANTKNDQTHYQNNIKIKQND